MSSIQYIDALVYWSGEIVSETNSVSIDFSVDVYDIKPLCSAPSDTFVLKIPNWIGWSINLEGYYDDTSFTMQNNIENNQAGTVLVYPTRTSLWHWEGQAITRNLLQSTNTGGYSTLGVDFESNGRLMWLGDSRYILEEDSDRIAAESGGVLIMEA